MFCLCTKSRFRLDILTGDLQGNDTGSRLHGIQCYGLHGDVTSQLCCQQIGCLSEEQQSLIPKKHGDVRK